MRVQVHYPRIGDLTVESVPETATVRIVGIGQGADGEATYASAKRALAERLRAQAAKLEAEANAHEPKESEPYTWTLAITVAPAWVADGIDLSEPKQRARLMERAFPHLRSSEYDCVLVSAPDPEHVARAQGYRSAAHKNDETKGKR